jgi:hypothetical protein
MSFFSIYFMQFLKRVTAVPMRLDKIKFAERNKFKRR